MTIHAIGNGDACAYYDGASVVQAFGPTYSAPNAFALDCGGGWRTTRAAPGIFQSRRNGVAVTDWAAAPGVPALLRQVAGAPADDWLLTTDQPLQPVPAAIAPDSFFSECHPGAVVYPYEHADGAPRGYVSGAKRYFGLRLRDGLSLAPAGDAWRLRGTGTALFAFAATPEDLFQLLLAPAPAPRPAPAAPAPPFPQAQPFVAVIAGVHATIQAQTDAAGGVLAGHNYHLCYVRDNYGVYRGLRAMGAHADADRLARYYCQAFARWGDVHNGQGPREFAFHVHENDDVEITAYLALMLCDYLRRHPDDGAAAALAAEALRRQHRRLRRGMLPFNGDETYVAGGLLSRAFLNDGSLEATALYHQALCECEELAARAPAFALPGFAAADREAIASGFRDNFCPDGRWACHCPGLPAPGFRHGVRACGHGFGLAFRDRHGDYVCRACLDKDPPPLWPTPAGRQAVPAALLGPAFVGSRLIPPGEQIAAALAVMDACAAAGRGTGYDIGLALWVLSGPEAAAVPALRARAAQAREKLLAMRDEFGAWSEYYEDGFTRPCGTHCRPWESAVNLAAILRSAALA